jgi:DNA-binding NarL/FixJ family response regulator
VRHGLRAVLEAFAGCRIVLDAEDGLELLQRLDGAAVDVIVMDVRMPRLSGIEATRRLRAQGNAIPVVLLTTFDDPEQLRAAAAAGAHGYLLKDAEPDELEHAIRRAAAGERTLDTAAAGGAASAVLTGREIEVLKQAASGFGNKEIARMLDISPGTVRNHMSDILRKLDARDRTHAVLKAIEKRWM